MKTSFQERQWECGSQCIQVWNKNELYCFFFILKQHFCVYIQEAIKEQQNQHYYWFVCLTKMMALTNKFVCIKWVNLRPTHKRRLFKVSWKSISSSLKVDNETQSSQIKFHIVSVVMFGFQAITILLSFKIRLSPSHFFFHNSISFCISYFKENKLFYSTYIQAHFKAYIFSWLALRTDEAGSCPLRELGAVKKNSQHKVFIIH